MDEVARRRGPVLVELMGVAGSGKSTVFEGLLRRGPAIEPRPVLRRREHAEVTVRHAFSVVATLARHQALRRVASPQDLRLMTYVQALPDVLDRAGPDERTIVFDQGPIYLLARPRLRDERLEPWRKRTFDAWASRLHAVVWLDAPDAVLLERINDRPKWHALKGRESVSARNVLTKTRATYEELLAKLGSRSDGPSILRFDTSREAADDVVARILTALEGIRAHETARHGGADGSELQRASVGRAPYDATGDAAPR